MAALLAVLLGGCTGGSDAGDEAGDSKPGGQETTTPAAEPGKYRTLPDPCRTPDHGTLDALLPGIKAAPEAQREKLYDGEATVTYDTDRLVGCDWKSESAQAGHHLRIGFERVVSHDGAVSDDKLAERLYLEQELAADLPAPSPSGEPSDDASSGASADTGESEPAGGGKTGNGNKGDNGDKGGGNDEGGETPAPGKGDDDSGSADANDPNEPDSSDKSGGASDSPDPTAVPEGLEPRVLDGLGDQAFVDDELNSSGAAARRRTVTVVFRTSNVIVTVEYDEQPARGTEVPDSKEMQDNARELASKLAARFAE